MIFYHPTCQLKMHLFPALILAEAINMTYSDMLHQLNISTFYFYEPFLFQIFVPWKFIKPQAFLCLLSLLQSTATQVIISVNMFQILFVSNIIQYEITFFIKINVKVLTKFFCIYIWFKCQTLVLFLLIRTMVYRKNSL